LGVTRRAVDIDDDAIARITGRDCNGRARDNPVIAADRAEGSTFECRRLNPNYFKFYDLGR